MDQEVLLDSPPWQERIGKEATRDESRPFASRRGGNPGSIRGTAAWRGYARPWSVALDALRRSRVVGKRLLRRGRCSTGRGDQAREELPAGTAPDRCGNDRPGGCHRTVRSTRLQDGSE